MKTTNKGQRRAVYSAGSIEARRAVNHASREADYISGYALVFNQPSEVLWEEQQKPAREVIAPEAVSMALLDTCDIRMSMYHDDKRMLARSVNGEGSLSYLVDDHGVMFDFEVPDHYRGEEALAMVQRRDITGCSFAFSTDYSDPECVERAESDAEITYTVRRILRVYDFTLTPDPAYPATSVEARDAALARRESPATTPAMEDEPTAEKPAEQEAAPGSQVGADPAKAEPEPEPAWKAQVAEMRRLASR